jgi:hypothetical protein
VFQGRVRCRTWVVLLVRLPQRQLRNGSETGQVWMSGGIVLGRGSGVIEKRIAYRWISAPYLSPQPPTPPPLPPHLLGISIPPPHEANPARLRNMHFLSSYHQSWTKTKHVLPPVRASEWAGTREGPVSLMITGLTIGVRLPAETSFFFAVMSKPF